MCLTLPTRFSAEPATGMTGFLSPGLVGTDLETLLPVSPLGAAESGKQKEVNDAHLTGDKLSQAKGYKL